MPFLPDCLRAADGGGIPPSEPPHHAAVRVCLNELRIRRLWPGLPAFLAARHRVRNVGVQRDPERLFRCDVERAAANRRLSGPPDDTHPFRIEAVPSPMPLGRYVYALHDRIDDRSTPDNVLRAPAFSQCLHAVRQTCQGP